MNKYQYILLIGFSCVLFFLITKIVKNYKADEIDKRSQKNLAAPNSDDHESKQKEPSFQIELTEEEKNAKPENISDDDWIVTVHFHRFYARSNNGNVEFYGKVVDQNNKPIEGAKIKTTSTSFNESITDRFSNGSVNEITLEKEAVSNDRGLFSFSGYRAENLNILSIEKEGYSTPNSLLKGFLYSPQYATQHDADSADPVIYSLWKKGDPEPLFKDKWRAKLPVNDSFYSFDLINHKKIEEANNSMFRIRVTADYEAVEGTIQYPWAITLKAPKDGGIIVTNHPQPYGAPEGGYQSELTWDSDLPNGNWERDVEKTIYIKGPNGAYYASAKIRIIVFHTNNATILMETLVNPDGSRNLEYDSKIELKR